MCLFALLSLIKINNQDMTQSIHVHSCVAGGESGTPCSSLWYSGQQGLLSKDMVEGEQDIPAVQEINH